jgi:hypothetical protein
MRSDAWALVRSAGGASSPAQRLPVLVQAAVAGRAPTAASPCLDGEAGGPQEDGALLAHGTGWMIPYQDDGWFEYRVLDRA